MNWIVLLQTAVPFFLVAVLAFQRQRSYSLWLLNSLSFGLMISFLFASVRWELSSLLLRPLLPLLFVLASVSGYRRVRVLEMSRSGYWFGVLLNVVLIVGLSGFVWFSYGGYFAPSDAVNISSPLESGRYVVVHGGASPFTNGHFRVTPQDFGVDIVGIDAFGRRSTPLADLQDLGSYVIFGAPVLSPCVGSVVAVQDLFEDQLPPRTDVEHPAGNHVLIDCDGFEVLLAHLQSGSVLVAEGDAVTVGTDLGRVGNTGNTSEPHLHVHAERGGKPGVILDGTGVPFTIANRFLVRGSKLAVD